MTKEEARKIAEDRLNDEYFVWFVAESNRVHAKFLKDMETAKMEDWPRLEAKRLEAVYKSRAALLYTVCGND